MADYIYLLENRLSKPQQNALLAIREIARERGLTVFLVGGAVRDLTSGSPVRDLDVAVQGNALKLKKDIEKAGGVITGEHDAGQAIFATFPGGAKAEIGSTLSVNYPKPGKPVVKPSNILDDLRRRDFTANAMALSLNTGSYGLLMDPLNGVADIENRELRLVSNYGFIEDPIRMVRAIRLMARLGWQMDEKTRARYETGKQEGYISAASAFQRGYEAEEVVHEEDPLRVMRQLETEGWMEVLAPYWSSAKANVSELERLRESQTQLQLQGIQPNAAAANFGLLTAKLSAKEIAELKQSFPRQGFVREIEALEDETKEFVAQLSSKAAALPSQAWKLIHSAKPEAVLMAAHTSKSPAVQAKFKSFYTEWPQARQKVPYALLQEMRIVPELPGYDEFIDSLVFELMDGKLGTVEEMKAFLEPFSPPAPPPPVHLRRPRAAKKEAKAGKARAKKAAPDAESLSEAPAAGAPEKVELPVDSAPAVQPVESSAPPTSVEKPAVKSEAATSKSPAKLPTAVAAPKPLQTKKSGTAAATKSTPVKSVPAKKPVAAKAGIAAKTAQKSAAKKSAKPIAQNQKMTAKKSIKPVLKKAATKAATKVVAKAPAKKSVAKKLPAKVSAVKKTAKKVPSKPAKPVAKKRRG